MKIYFLLGIIFAGLTMNFSAASKPVQFSIPRSEVIQLQDPSTQRNYEIYVKLPRGYSSANTYPVLYMTDALNNFQLISGATEFPMNSGEMEKLILVGISWQDGISPALSRQRDYTPTLDPDWRTATGEAGTHLTFIRDHVINYVENHYSADPEKRSYFGYSLGGLFGAYVLITQPDTFSNYVLSSPSLWFDSEAIFSLEIEASNSITDIDASVFISIGELETPEHDQIDNNMVTQAERFHSQLLSRKFENLEQKLIIIESANHALALPTGAIHGLYWLFNIDEKEI